jgi:hypothetical protein
MPFCPKCKTEYRPGFRTCSDCGSPLVATFAQCPKEVHPDEDQLVMVYDPPDPMMCLSIAALLEENGIDCAVRSGSGQIWLYEGATSATRRQFGKVMVLEGDRERAEELITCYLSAPVPEDHEASGDSGQTAETTEPEEAGEEK